MHSIWADLILPVWLSGGDGGSGPSAGQEANPSTIEQVGLLSTTLQYQDTRSLRRAVLRRVRYQMRWPGWRESCRRKTPPGFVSTSFPFRAKLTRLNLTSSHMCHGAIDPVAHSVYEAKEYHNISLGAEDRMNTSVELRISPVAHSRRREAISPHTARQCRHTSICTGSCILQPWVAPWALRLADAPLALIRGHSCRLGLSHIDADDSRCVPAKSST